MSTAYPLLPLRDIVVFPHMIVPLFVGRDKSVAALKEGVIERADFDASELGFAKPTLGDLVGGEANTNADILEGILRVTVLVAISRPAEFIEITFQQQMQKS